MCDQCSAGPFVNQLALTGHKVTAHAKKTVKRLKKPGVSAYTPVAKSQQSVKQHLKLLKRHLKLLLVSPQLRYYYRFYKNDS